jgi:site-specific DNA-methyltransferase (adenine-specific)
MSRIETIGDTILYLGDCREILPSLSKIDAVVTDGPYGINYQHGTVTTGKWQSRHHEQKIQGDNEPFDPAPFLALAHECIFFGANNFAERLPRGDWLVWDKRDGIENVKFSMSEAELAWRRNDEPGAIRVFRNLWFGLARTEEVGEHYHPTQKPVALMRWCLELLPPSCRLILDPFMGSGSTGVAAIKLKRQFIGIEKHEPYFDIACRRIEYAHARPELSL